MIDPTSPYGLLAEFERPENLLSAASAAREAGYVRIEAYTPMPLEGLIEALGKVPTQLPRLTLAGGLLGAIGGFALQYYTSIIDYPLNVGGRPLDAWHGWPAFVPVVFETTVLGAALFSVFGMLALNGLPMPYHPVFNVPEFKLASRDRFFLCIEARDRLFDPERTRQFLESLGPRSVRDVPR